jgi:hypothetical protein
MDLGQGLKLKFIGGPHSEEKMLCGPHVNRKKLLRAAISKTSPQNKQAKFHQNFNRIYNFVIFWDVRGPHNCIWLATCGPRV